MHRIALPTILLLLSACASYPAASPAVQPHPTPTHTPAPTLTATPVVSPTPSGTASPTEPTCIHQPGQIITAEIEDPGLPRSLPYRVYLPPCYGQEPDTRYPTLYLLHGLASTDSQWDDLGVNETADALISSGEVAPFLIVMPWERRGLEFETAIADFLVPAIDRMYQTLPYRSGRALGGISRGAGWTLRIGLQHPEAFGSLGLHSPAVLTPDLYAIPAWVQDIPSGGLPRIWIDAGDHDVLRSSTEELLSILDAEGVAYTWHLFPGYHEAAYWSAHLEEYLRWYAAPW
jgi:enterochelin esterase-like enzyme